MTTTNIPGIDELGEMQRRIDKMMAEAVQTRNAELQAEADRLEGQRARLQREHDAAEANAQLAARLRQQQLADQNNGINAQAAVISEEQGQLGFILNGAPAVVAPDPIVIVPATIDPVPVSPTLPPPSPVVVPTPPAAGAPAPTMVQQIVEQDRVRSVTNVRNYSTLQWFFAIIMAIFVRFVVAEGYHPQVLGDLSGGFRSFFSILYFAGMIVIGFGLGGAIGAFIDSRRENRASTTA